MTVDEFNTYRLNLINTSSDLCWKMCKKIKIDQKWNNDYYRLYVLNRYIDLMLEYDITRAEGENFLSSDDIMFIQEKINIMLNTDYSGSFVLTT